MSSPNLNPRELMALYTARQFDDLSDRFLALLAHFGEETYPTLSPQNQIFVNAFIKHFLYLYSQADYALSERHARAFIRLNVTIANLVAVSAFGSTDAHLELLLAQENSAVAKILALYSARNAIRIDRRMLVDRDPALASLWYTTYCQIHYGGLVNERVCRSLREHYEYHDDRLALTHAPQEPFFGSTYVDGKCDRLIKPVINQTYRRIAQQHVVRNTPNPRKIAVLSGLWTPHHSVYRNYAHYVRALRGHYHLTFFQLGDSAAGADESMFDEVRHIGNAQGGVDVTSLLENDYQLAYFPDVGMTPQSIVLANMRLAPIQITSPGHSASTWGADIDYYVSGADVEVAENPEQNYSERLVLLPGCGVIHNRPLYEPRGIEKTVPEFVINCAAFSQKMNFGFCRLLQRIAEASQKPLRLRLFVGSTLRGQACFPVFVRELGTLLPGVQLEVIGNRTYGNYMGLMEEGDLAIDSFHFGGCNTIADSLFLRIPTVTYEGDKWYNRIGSQMLRMVGLPELITTNDDDYFRLVSRLIQDDDFRAGIRARLAEADLDATLFSAATADGFRQAVDFLIGNHARLSRSPDRSALRIGRIATVDA
jgi:hypothetical protein